jgi:uncharacterized protein (TIGR02246 family)
MVFRTLSTQLIREAVMTGATTAQDVRQISTRYFAAWEARDPDAIVALHTEETQFQAHAGGEPVKGREAVREEFAQVFERFPRFEVETHRVLYGDAYWVLDWTLSFQPDGEARRGFRCLDVVEVSTDGLVSRKDTFFDLIQLQAALPEIQAEAQARIAESA